MITADLCQFDSITVAICWPFLTSKDLFKLFASLYITIMRVDWSNFIQLRPPKHPNILMNFFNNNPNILFIWMQNPNFSYTKCSGFSELQYQNSLSLFLVWHQPKAYKTWIIYGIYNKHTRRWTWPGFCLVKRKLPYHHPYVHTSHIRLSGIHIKPQTGSGHMNNIHRINMI